MADTPSPSPPERAPLEVVGERLRRMTGASHQFTHLLLLLTVSVCATFVISPGLYGQHLPELQQTDVGQPFRAASPSGFKATREYEIVHSETTEERREEARVSVRPVFDFDPTVSVGIRKTMSEAFEEMRTSFPAIDHAPPSEPSEDEASGARKKKSEQEALNDAFYARRKAFESRVVPPDDEDFHALVTARFSKQVEQVVVSLLERAYLSPLVSGRDELARGVGTGITVRSLGASEESNTLVLPPAVLDVREAQAELDRFASVPGNFPPDWPVLLRRAVLRLAKTQLRPNLYFNAEETKSRRDAAATGVRDAVIQIKKGQKVIGDGELITPTHLVILRGMGAQRDPMDLLQLQLGGALLVALIISFTFAFFRASFKRFRPTRKDGILLAMVLLTSLGALHVWVGVADAIHDRYSNLSAESLYYLAPVAAGAMLIRFLLSDLVALFFALVSSVLSALLMGNSLPFGIFTLVTSLAGAQWISQAKERSGIFKSGVAAGIAGAFAVIALGFAEGKGLSGEVLMTAMAASFGGMLVAPMMVMAFTPLVESLLGYASDIKLLELANLNHPALKELIVQAPGTYHHSIIIGSLVESAAEAIGANPLLARSCAYYHDIGKGRNPLYFGENQRGENRHDTLAPAMSAVIIKRHVTEGMEMARQYKLPRRVADAIPQHHGTRLVGYFFHKAMKEQEGKENPQPVDESIYRYAGPKPQFREAALVMIADAVEAASRSMPEPNATKLQALVQKLINVIFSEGQLDECDLTLKDLNLIAQSFAHTLEGIYHARPAYPAGAVGGPKAVESSASTKSKSGT
jgi:putative nucleotidyltransferase with HDIG domain